jgi:hypothetical protein
MATRHDILDFYRHPAKMTSIGKHASRVEALPGDIDALTRVVPDLLLYEYVASEFYGITIPDDRRFETHIRPVEEILDRLLAVDDRPLDVARPLENRLVGVCHHFMLLLVGLARAKGVPARARCGFGSYFNPPYFEDHWVCEYWNEEAARWVLVDPQMDDVWRRKLDIDFDPLDVPRDRFVGAADAWGLCRAGEADQSKFGIFKGDLRGLWFIAGSLVRDVAALNKMELLPWDQWGAIPRSDGPLDDDRLAFFDRLAALTRSPDASFEELRALYESDDRVRVQGTVVNALMNRSEPV